MRCDQFHLRRRLKQLQSGPLQDPAALAELTAALRSSADRRARRHALLPVPSYPTELPVVTKKDEIARAIASHQVVIVCGETGSGKTTQLPKICLEVGRGVSGLIGHTQPRRIAARSVAARIAQELHCEIGTEVGFKVRFSDHVGTDTYIKLMTDGILLAEMQGDRFLDQYDTLIIDEAHERSLNIDFLLGYLKRLLPKRPDLKVIVTSATIDPQSFSHYFGGAPVIDVSGRTYPVEVRYRPLQAQTADDAERDLQQAILDAVDELSRDGPGDILVFLAGERDIRETAEALRKHHPPHTEILPLYSRLSVAEQNLVFQPHRGRRIVLATNVAETSLTVPGIRYVIDPGYARISRYSHRSQVQRLPIEPISQAAAEQRKGRCGRVAPGICIRLYSEEDFSRRERFIAPEILRTNLAGVILQMQSLGLGDVARFPFINTPDTRYVNDGYRLLFELGAVDSERRLTALGRELARLPIDVRLGRMLLAAQREGCLTEVTVICAALAVQDPRDRPLDAQQRADEAHRAYADERSDFVAYLKLWSAFHEHKRHLSHAKLRRWCREHFLSYTRLREWEDIHQQLKALLSARGARTNELEAQYEPLHRALLAGLLGNVALRVEGGEYLGVRNRRLNVHPGSGLFRKSPKWIMAAEVVETTRLYARTVAAIDPTWIEAVAGHLLRRSYAEPHWERKRAQVCAFEKTTLYGLVISAQRKVDFCRVDPRQAREIFIRNALVGEDYPHHASFLQHNRCLREEAEALEHRSRRRDIVVDEERLFAFYDARIPADVCSGASFEAWRRRVERASPDFLCLSIEDLLREEATRVDETAFPEALTVNGIRLALQYRFEPGHPEDGVTAVIPLAALNQLQPLDFDWLVPGLLRDKLVALIKSLPKALRRNFVPAPEFADACLQAMVVRSAPLPEALSAELRRMTGIEIAPDVWNEEALPAHLRMHFRVVDKDGRELGAGRDLAALQGRLAEHARRDFDALAAGGRVRNGITRWDFGELQPGTRVTRDGICLPAFPALVDAGDSVALRWFDTPTLAEQETRHGVRRLFMLALRDKVKYLRRHLPDLQTMCLYYAPLGTCEALREDIIAAVFDRVFINGGPLPLNAAQFEARLDDGAGRLLGFADAFCVQVSATLGEYHGLARRLSGQVPAQWLAAVADIRTQLAHLVYPGFVTATPAAWWPHLPRYLRAIAVRLTKLEQHPARDHQAQQEIASLWGAYLAVPAERRARDSAWQEFHWLLEELRVSLFAQELKTSLPVSVKRLKRHLEALRVST